MPPLPLRLCCAVICLDFVSYARLRERPSRVCPDWPLGSQSGLHKRGQAASHLKADRRLVGKASVAVKPPADGM